MESVTEASRQGGRQISDGVLDAVLRDDPYGRVACETLVNTGPSSSPARSPRRPTVDIQEIAREIDPQDRATPTGPRLQRRLLRVLNAIDKQSPDIAQGVRQRVRDAHGPPATTMSSTCVPGDQGMMFGYASNETAELMPLPISLAHKLAKRAGRRAQGRGRPVPAPGRKDAGLVRYRDGVPVEIEKLLISTQHREGAESLNPATTSGSTSSSRSCRATSMT